jgi:hypothetical protein
VLTLILVITNALPIFFVLVLMHVAKRMDEREEDLACLLEKQRKGAKS